MSDFVNEEPESGEELIDEELSPTGEERKSWEETNDDPAQGEAGQDSV
jgi:hypothetical protein